MRKLDRIDRLILDILQREGRIAISELASRVNLSTTPCSERVKRLEREGIIRGTTLGLILRMLIVAYWCFWKSNCQQNQVMSLIK